MTELTPGLIALKDELMPAFRRDHERRQGRLKLARTAAITLAAFAALSGSALAAGSAFGIIDLGGGVSAALVTTQPVWDGTTGTFNSGTATGQYIYEFGGVGADIVVCGPADPDVAQFVTSSKPLTQSDLESLLDPANPSGMNPNAELNALGITDESGGCFPASVAGPLATPQTPSQAAAAKARTANITPRTAKIPAQLRTVTPGSGSVGNAHLTRPLHVTITHNGKRAIITLPEKSVP